MTGLTRLFSELDRLGPGSAESLRWALGVAGLAQTARVLDAGCGTGADTGTLLAEVPKGDVVALDRHQAFVDRVKARFPRARAQVADFLDPPGGPFDLIWSAGAVDQNGIERTLGAWRAVLADGGRVAFSQLAWRGEERPDAVCDVFEMQARVRIKDPATLDTEIARAGFKVLGARWLGVPEWASYYGPLEVELDEFDGDPELVASLRQEIAVWRTHGVSYSFRLTVCEAQ